MFTLVIALAGLALGIINLWRSISRDRICLRVRPEIYLRHGGSHGLCVCVINLGFFPVTIRSAWLIVAGTHRVDLGKVEPDGFLPQRLDPRAMLIAVPSTPHDYTPLTADVRAFVTTACDLRFSGRHRHLMEQLEMARAPKGGTAK